MPPPAPKAKAVTSLVLAPKAEGKAGPQRIPPKILNPGDAARAGALNEPPAGRPEGGIKGRKQNTAALQDYMGADARAQQIAQARTQELPQPSSGSGLTPAERAAAEAQLQELRRRQMQTTGKSSGTPPAVLAPGTPPVIGAPGAPAIGALASGTRPSGNPGTPGTAIPPRLVVRDHGAATVTAAVIVAVATVAVTVVITRVVTVISSLVVAAVAVVADVVETRGAILTPPFPPNGE